ncbi:MAG: CarD family transcriptional regulator [Hyphomicrobiales bacterium]|nr:CarD family transcriptional regulator [Hyphomicrobiales bacterium]
MNKSANQLLQKLTDEDWTKIKPFLKTVELQSREVLMEPDTEIRHVWFPLNCACSMIAVPDESNAIEVGMFGPEGMSNMVVRVGDRTFMRTQAFIAGQALRIDTIDFVAALATLPSLNELTLRYKEAFANQLAYGSAANGAFTIEQRLARWLLMAFDRASQERLPIVHDLIASVLSVRRSGVTTALHVIEGTGAVKATRGLITLRDRDKLEDIAGACYGYCERTFEFIMTYDPTQPRTQHK